jgi:hypothetical protein
VSRQRVGKLEERARLTGELVIQLATFWRDRTLQDPFQREKEYQQNPRQIALKGLVQQYPEHPKTQELLLDRAQNDSDEQLRTWAQKQRDRLGLNP